MKPIWCKHYFLLIIQALLVFWYTSAYAAFKDTGWGARSLGMGGASVAIADDVNAVVHNPAGLGEVAHPEVSFMSAQLFYGLEGVDIANNYLSMVYPLGKDRGSFGIAWTSLMSPSLYREDAGLLAYGRSLVQGKVVRVNAGLAVKYLRHEFTLDERTIDDPVFADASLKSVMTVDAGIRAAFAGGWQVGIAGRNLTRPDIGLYSEDIVPAEYALGIGYKRDRVLLPFGFSLPKFTIEVDGVVRDTQQDIRAGMESWFFNDSLAVRAGMRTAEITAGVGYCITAWAGKRITIDYALGWPLEIEESSGSHRIALTIRFE